jgi:hypothetical protein
MDEHPIYEDEDNHIMVDIEDEDENDVQSLETKEKNKRDKIKKKNLGKFYTENYQYIFQHFDLPDYQQTQFIEPFVGMGHLCSFLSNYYHIPISELHIETYDLENHYHNVTIQDTIRNPPNYENKFVITNPPFLARNKCEDKEIFNMYGYNDLYKCFLKTLIHQNCEGGLLILPINFLSSIRKSDILLRKLFLEKYKILGMNLFEEKVFHDTSFMVCSFLFQRRMEDDDDYLIRTMIYPQKINKEFEISENTFWMIGGELYHLPQNKDIVISRVYRKNDGSHTPPNTRLFLHALDDGKNKRIHLEFMNMDKDLFIGIHSDRSYCSIHISPAISIERQQRLAEQFNLFIEEHRERTHSMFLTNYRESKEFARKRISFQFAYQIMNYLLSTIVI